VQQPPKMVPDERSAPALHGVEGLGARFGLHARGRSAHPRFRVFCDHLVADGRGFGLCVVGGRRAPRTLRLQVHVDGEAKRRQKKAATPPSAREIRQDLSRMRIISDRRRPLRRRSSPCGGAGAVAAQQGVHKTNKAAASAHFSHRSPPELLAPAGTHGPSIARSVRRRQSATRCR